MGRRRFEGDADGYPGEPAPGDIWWCGGDALGLGDGGKVRPVLVVRAEVDVIALTSRKPSGKPVGVAHAGGTSWMTESRRWVPEIALVSPLGRWAGFEAWRQTQMPDR
jgi:hypothetical protein